MYAIECKNLTHYYGRKLVYENLSFNVEEGKIWASLARTAQANRRP